MTDSPLSLGIVWATRASPYLFLGVMAGAIADRFNRRILLLFGHITLALLALLMGFLITIEGIRLWNILAITLLMGVVNVFNLPARQVLAVDIVGRKGTMNAISINAVGIRIIGVFGGAAAGFIINLFGTEWAFFVMTASYLLGATLLSQIRGVKRREGKGDTEQPSTWENFVEGLRLIAVNQIVLVLLVITAVCEILGFSWMVLLPVFARDILEVGAVGLGMFYTSHSLGGLIGALSLASLGDYKHKGRLILGIFFAFGFGLVLFSQSPWYGISLIIAAILGASASGMDAMGHTILQLNVNDEQRGRAMGVWMMSIGFGPVGHLTVGAVAAALSAPITLTINGSAIIVTFLFMLLFVPQVRRI
jgi:MFS family permease